MRAISMLASSDGSPRTAALSERSLSGSLLGMSLLTAPDNANESQPHKACYLVLSIGRQYVYV